MIESITECCSSLLDEFPSIYEMKKEDLARLVIVDVPTKNHVQMNYSISQKQWEYKWQVKEDGSIGESEVYGVFNTAQMIEWHEAVVLEQEMKNRDVLHRTHSFDEQRRRKRVRRDLLESILMLILTLIPIYRNSQQLQIHGLQQMRLITLQIDVFVNNRNK